MRLFDSMIKGIIMYGVELWGWKEQKALERMQETYLKWVLKLDRNTPSYSLMLETGREKLESIAAERMMKWEKKMSRKEVGSLERICWEKNKKEHMKGREEATSSSKERDRRKLLERTGYSGIEWVKRIENGEDEKGMRETVSDRKRQE